MQNTTTERLRQIMTRREWIGVSAGAAVAAQQPPRQQQRISDPVLHQLVLEQAQVITEIHKNNHRITAETAKRLAIPLRTLAVYGSTIQLSERWHAAISNIVRQKGRDYVLDIKPDPDHVAHELAPYGLDVSDELRRIPALTRERQNKVLDDVLAQPDWLTRTAARLADGLEKMAATGRLVRLDAPAQVRPVMLQQIPCWDCGWFWWAVSTAVAWANTICFIPGVGTQACVAAYAIVASALAAALGCELMNHTGTDCTGGTGQP